MISMQVGGIILIQKRYGCTRYDVYDVVRKQHETKVPMYSSQWYSSLQILEMERPRFARPPSVRSRVAFLFQGGILQ